jgi:hypothetical protein
MKTYGEVVVKLYVFLTSALVGGVVSFTSQPLYHRGKNCRHTMDRMIGESQSWSGRYEKLNIF